MRAKRKRASPDEDEVAEAKDQEELVKRVRHECGSIPGTYTLCLNLRSSTKLPISVGAVIRCEADANGQSTLCTLTGCQSCMLPRAQQWS